MLLVNPFSVQSRGSHGAISPIFVKWHFDKDRVDHPQYYMNGEILDRVLFSFEIKCK